MQLPPGFVKIKDIRPGVPSLSCIGVITYMRGVAASRGEDDVLQFCIRDDFSPSAAGDELVCKFFRRRDEMPIPGNTGDLVLIRNFTAKEFRGRIEIVSSRRDFASVVFFPQDKIPAPAFSTGYGVGGSSRLPSHGTMNSKRTTPVEQMYIILLKEAASSSLPQVKQDSTQRTFTQPTMRDRSALIKDIEFKQFYDLVGEVVKIWGGTYDTVDFYITDYTTNHCLHFYEDPKTAVYPGTHGDGRWKGPFGQVTLVIRAWEPHATFIKNKVKEGDIIHVDNVHIKLSRANKMEGALHRDIVQTDKVYVRHVTSDQKIEALKMRKREYELQCEIRAAREVLEDTRAYQKLGKESKKKAKKKEEARVRRQIEQKEMDEQADEDLITRTGCNAHIRASHPNIKMSSVSEILHNSGLRTRGPTGIDMTLPFVNCKYRSRVRVVDFSPNSLEDFSHSMADPTWNNLLNDPDYGDRRRDDRWQWAFVLLVEDADVLPQSTPERMLLFVANGDAEYLLKMSATNLRNDPTGIYMKSLEEKMFIVWGNLLEIKKELGPKGVTFPLPPGDNRLQNRPFDVCIEEYGVKVPRSTKWPEGWQRMFKMVSTTMM